MEQKIIDKISLLTNKINDLLIKREELIKDLQSTEANINTLYITIHELKDLLSENQE